jgi:hypothetical protein
MRFDMQGVSEDRILYWPTILAVAGPAVVVLIWFAIVLADSPISSLFGWLLLFLIAAAWAFAGVGTFVVACLELFLQRAWRRALSSLVLPLAVLVAGLNFENIWNAQDSAHFFLRYPSLRAEIDKMPADKPRFVVWGWRTTRNAEIGLAYDESDEIASDHPSETWKLRANRVGVLGSGYRPLYGHFYLIIFDLSAGNAHSAKQDVEDTKLGYRLYESGRIRLRR